MDEALHKIANDKIKIEERAKSGLFSECVIHFSNLQRKNTPKNYQHLSIGVKTRLEFTIIWYLKAAQHIFFL